MYVYNIFDRKVQHPKSGETNNRIKTSGERFRDKHNGLICLS